MATVGNPLFGSYPVTPPPSGGQPNMPFGTPVTGPPQGPWGNPGNFANPKGGYETQRNVADTNIQTGQMRNQLIPLFASLMQKYGGNAGQFFQTLMNLGSPFYKQKQQQSFEQGTKAGQDAAAQSREQLQASGTGYTPSGAGAAMMGGEAQAEAGNQEEMFLNNLFQNEQLQMAGAGGLSQLAALFNPASLTGQQTSQGGEISKPSSFFTNFDQMMQGLFAPSSAAKTAMQPQP